MLKILWLSNFAIHDTSSTVCCYAKTMLEQLAQLLKTEVQIKAVCSLASHTHLNGLKNFIESKQELKEHNILSFVENDIEYFYARCHNPEVAKHTLSDMQLLFEAYTQACDNFKADVLIGHGLNHFVSSIFSQAQSEGVKTVYFMSNSRYKDFSFKFYDQVWTDLQHIANYSNINNAVNSLYVGSFVNIAKVKCKAYEPEYVTFIKPTAQNGLAYFAKIADLSQTRFPHIKFLVVDSFSSFKEDLANLKVKQADGSFTHPYSILSFKNVVLCDHTDDISKIYDKTKGIICPCLDNDLSYKEIIEALANNIPVLSSNLSSKTDAVYCGGLTLPISKECLADPYLVPSDEDVEDWLVSLEKFELNYNKVAHLCQKSLKHFKLEDNVKNAAELLSVLCKK